MVSVAHSGVAMDAGQHFGIFTAGQHLVNDCGVAIQAGTLRHAAVPGFDMNRIVKILQRECQGVEKTVVRFHDQLSDRVVRQVAIVAHGHVSVAGLFPRIEMRLHHVAIRAIGGIIAKIAGAFAIAERKHPDACQHAQHDGKDDRDKAETTHKFGDASGHHCLRIPLNSGSRRLRRAAIPRIK
jgi:hypothetical protein